MSGSILGSPYVGKLPYGCSQTFSISSISPPKYSELLHIGPPKKEPPQTPNPKPVVLGIPSAQEPRSLKKDVLGQFHAQKGYHSSKDRDAASPKPSTLNRTLNPKPQNPKPRLVREERGSSLRLPIFPEGPCSYVVPKGPCTQ